jgi:transcriptional regulator with XRE-family HTH domain
MSEREVGAKERRHTMAKYGPFGHFIREARTRANLEQADMAKAIGLTPGYYPRMERGEFMVSLTVLAALCRALQISASELLPVLDCKSAPIESTTDPVLQYPIVGPNREFGRLLLETRRERQWTTGQIAESIECNPLTYYHWETGRSLPRVAFFANLWHCMRFDANRLLDAALADSHNGERRGTNRNTTVIYEAFGSLLRAARIRANLAGDDVAKAIKLSRWHYRRAEDGYTMLSLRSMALLRRFLQIDATELLSVLDWKSAPIVNTSKAGREKSRRLGEHREFGRLLMTARREREWTVLQVAQSIGCDVAIYYQWEGGRTLPIMANFARLWHCLGFDANRLLDAVLATGEGAREDAPTGERVLDDLSMARAGSLARLSPQMFVLMMQTPATFNRRWRVVRVRRFDHFRSRAEQGKESDSGCL